MAKISDFAQGAYAAGSKVTKVKTIPIKTSVVSVPPNRYGTTARRRKRA